MAKMSNRKSSEIFSKEVGNHSNETGFALLFFLLIGILKGFLIALEEPGAKRRKRAVDVMPPNPENYAVSVRHRIRYFYAFSKK
jgi:hypothetical protein